MARSTRGFDWLRLILATGVLVFHSYGLCLPASAAARGFGSMFVPMFFAVSGFLVAASAERNNLLTFASLRALRLLPALVVTVTLTVVGLGLISTAPDYYARPDTWAYIFDGLGMKHTRLPGVFETNSISTVNVSVWTIPYELLSYAILGGLSLFIFRRRGVFLAGFLLALAAYTVLDTRAGWSVDVTELELVLCFMGGVALYLYRDRVTLSWPVACVLLIAGFALNAAGVPVLAAVPLTYAAVAFGLLPAPALRDDLSYGIYLIAYPVQQVLIVLGVVTWWPHVALSLLITVALAALSWFGVERPILRRKALVMAWKPLKQPVKADLRA